MTLEQHIENEAQRLFATLGPHDGHDIAYYRALAQRLIAPSAEQIERTNRRLRQLQSLLTECWCGHPAEEEESAHKSH